MLKTIVSKANKFIDVTTANEMQAAALAEEMHTHAKKINEYENGKLTVAQQQKSKPSWNRSTQCTSP